MLHFPENEGGSRKLKKVQELVQHFCEQCRHYVPKQNIIYKSIDKKGKGKTKNCSVYKSETNPNKTWFGLMWYLGQS